MWKTLVHGSIWEQLVSAGGVAIIAVLVVRSRFCEDRCEVRPKRKKWRDREASLLCAVLER